MTAECDANYVETTLPRLTVEKLALENLAERDVLEAVEPADRIELLHVDVAAGHAGRIDMHIDHLADHQRMAVRAKLDYLVQLALENDRHLLDPRRLDLHARDRGEAGLFELAVPLRNAVGRIHHLLPHALRHHVEAELAILSHVLQRVLLAAVGVARNRQRDHRRDDADHGEEG